MVNLDRVLITGAGGMVGSYADFGIRTDRRQLDVADIKAARDFCFKCRPEAIIHLAAETDVDRCEHDPEHAYMANAVGTYNMVTAAKEFGAKFVYISTDAIFDGKKKGPYTEEDEGNPQNYYGRSKFLGELIVKSMLSNYVIARICWVFGGGPQKDHKFVAKIIQQFNKPEIKAVTDQIGSPTFGKDLMRGIKTLLERDETGIFNMANRGSCSRYEFAKAIVEVLKPGIKVVPATMKDFNVDAMRTFNEVLVSKVDIMRPWQEALEEYLETEWQPYLKSQNARSYS